MSEDPKMLKISEDSNKKSFSEKQKWVFTVVISLLILGLGWKLIWANYNISQFTFSDLLALLLALFSIGISVAFYFKATDSSNRFYDNTYKFTKDIAELLVKIESGFGEKLQHLDDGYNKISDRFEKFNPSIIRENIENELEESKKEVEKKEQEKEIIIKDSIEKAKIAEPIKEELIKILKEHDNLLKETLEKAHLNEVEEQELIAKLNQKDSELLLQKNKVAELEKSLSTFHKIENLEIPKNFHFLVDKFLKENDTATLFNLTGTGIKRRMDHFLNNLPFDEIDQLRHQGLLDNDLQLTNYALGYIYTRAQIVAKMREGTRKYSNKYSNSISN